MELSLHVGGVYRGTSMRTAYFGAVDIRSEASPLGHLNQATGQCPGGRDAAEYPLGYLIQATGLWPGRVPVGEPRSTT